MAAPIAMASIDILRLYADISNRLCGTDIEPLTALGPMTRLRCVHSFVLGQLVRKPGGDDVLDITRSVDNSLRYPTSHEEALVVSSRTTHDPWLMFDDSFHCILPYGDQFKVFVHPNRIS